MTQVRRATQILPTEFTTTSTGNIDNLDFSNADVIRMNNASSATIRGLKAGSAGQLVAIVSVGAGQVNLAHQNTNSTAANRLINFVTSGDTPLAAGVGVAILQYDATTARWRLLAHESGWIAIAYAAGNYTADTGTWTVDSGDQIGLRYRVSGSTILYQFNIQTTSTSSAGAFLRLALPNGYTVGGSGTVTGITRTNAAGAASVPGTSRATAGNSYIEFRSDFTSAGYAVSTNDCQVVGEIEVQLT